MEGPRFDALAVRVAAGASRRGLLRGAAAGALTGTLAWLGITRARTQAADRPLPAAQVPFPVQPVCTCPEGLVLCDGVCLPAEECAAGRQAEAGAEEVVPTAIFDPECPPQEQFCEATGQCVPCPAAMSLDANCRCRCREGDFTTCSASCECPKVAVCACACPGPPCAPPKVQHAETCECLCPTTCPRPFVVDPATCSCVCPPEATLCGRRCVLCPPGADVDPARCDCVCETIAVPTDGSTVTSQTTLIAGTVYTIRASGLFNIGGKQADAEYLVGPTNNQLADKCGAAGGFADIGLAIDDPNLSGTTKTPASWGPYRADHVYTTTYTGRGSPIALNYHECPGFFGDNRGTLTVQILCPIEPVDPIPVDEVPGGEATEPTATPIPAPTATPEPAATNTPVPAPTATSIPSGPPTCGPDELLCIDRCIPASDCPAANCCFEPATCTCTCLDCGENRVFEPTTCSCVCQPPPCLPNWQVDEETCTCVCLETPCPEGQVFDQPSCSCVPADADTA